MNETQARILREAHDGYVKSIYRKPKAQLATMYRAELAAQGTTLVYGGPASKDELVSALVELRYPLAKMNESIHVLWHTGEIRNEVCEYCNPDPCPKCGALQGQCEYSPEHGGTVNGRHHA